MSIKNIQQYVHNYITIVPELPEGVPHIVTRHHDEFTVQPVPASDPVLNPAKTLGQLDALVDHWSRRGLGHTYAMRHGSDRTGALVLGANQAHARALVPANDPRRAVGLDTLTPKRLTGVRTPLVADHYAMGLLLAEAASTIRTLLDFYADAQRSA